MVKAGGDMASLRLLGNEMPHLDDDDSYVVIIPRDYTSDSGSVFSEENGVAPSQALGLGITTEFGNQRPTTVYQKNGMLVVEVGVDKRLLTLHIDHLPGYSKLLHTAVAEAFPLDLVKLHDIDVGIFQLYLDFYRRNWDVPALAASLDWISLIKAYILAEKLKDEHFECKIEDSLRTKAAITQNSAGLLFDHREIQYAYKHASSGLHLRSILVDIHISSAALSGLAVGLCPNEFIRDVQAEKSNRHSVVRRIQFDSAISDNFHIFELNTLTHISFPQWVQSLSSPLSDTSAFSDWSDLVHEYRPRPSAPPSNEQPRRSRRLSSKKGKAPAASAHSGPGRKSTPPRRHRQARLHSAEYFSSSPNSDE